jgi:hypothetical protein
MRRTRVAGAVAVGLATLVLAAPSRPAMASTDRMNLFYEVYSGGFHVLNFELDLALAPERYDVTARIRSAGVVGWFMSWQQVAVSQGQLGPESLVPTHHHSEGEFRGRRRSVEIDYDAGQVSTVRIQPPANEDEGRDEVSIERRREAMDPISSILNAIRRISAGQSCGGRLPVFDGRRRYDLVLTDRSNRAPGLPQLAGAPAGQVQCDFVYERIAGHDRRDPDPESKNKKRIQSGRVFAERNGPLVVPVRIEMDGDWGMTIAHLREIRRDDCAPAAAGASLPQRPAC